jgi:hypothetical protein
MVNAVLVDRMTLAVATGMWVVARLATWVVLAVAAAKPW